MNETLPTDSIKLVIRIKTEMLPIVSTMLVIKMKISPLVIRMKTKTLPIVSIMLVIKMKISLI